MTPRKGVFVTKNLARGLRGSFKGLDPKELMKKFSL